MEDRIRALEKEIAAIRERNIRVETDKAWETSATRKLLVAAMTYIVVAIVLYIANVNEYLIGALVPAVAYLLSVQSLPAIRRRWLKR